MSFQIQITVDSIAEAERILACLRHDNPPAARQVNAQVESGKNNPEVAPAKPRGRPRKEESAAPAAVIGVGDGVTTEFAAPTDEYGQPLARAEGVPQEDSRTDKPEPQTPPTLEDVKSAIQELLARHNGDMAPALEILSKFGARSASFVEVSDRSEFIAACKEA